MNNNTNTFQHEDIDFLIGQLHKTLNDFRLKIDEMETEREKVANQLDIEEDYSEKEELERQLNFIDGHTIAMGECDNAISKVINSYVSNEIQRMIKEGAK